MVEEAYLNKRKEKDDDLKIRNTDCSIKFIQLVPLH